jgi:hypothetical protein
MPEPLFVGAGSLIGEVEGNGVLAGGKRVLRLPADALKVHKVVEKYRLALEQVETVSAEATA